MGFALYQLAGSGKLCRILCDICADARKSGENPVFFLITGIFFICTVLFGSRIIQLLFPESRFRALGNSVLAALKEAGYITSACQVMTERNREFDFFSWLKGGTDREKGIYADTLRQAMAPAENQRYLLVAGRIRKGAVEYYCVPELFSGSRQKAESFQRAMLSVMGRNNLIYTRNPAGRRVLLKARASSFFNRNDRCADQKKYIRGNLE